MKILLSLTERLNGWQSIGIILSIVWAVGMGLHTHHADVKNADDAAALTYKVCTYSQLVAHDSNLSSCNQKREETLETYRKSNYGNAVFVALAPIPFFWLGAFILLYIWRAQVIGFRAVIPWVALSWSKKLFVIFCSLVSFLIVIFGITDVLNLYVDTQVPVMLSPFLDVIIPGGQDFATIEGTWTRTDLTEDTIANPLQTSKIECNKQEMMCRESRASVTGDTLITDATVYNIESWTPASIIFRNDDLCATEIFTADLNTNVVSGAGHLINENDSACKSPLASSKQSWSYQLVHGSKVYWELRQKARPLPLRLIQTLFGN